MYNIGATLRPNNILLRSYFPLVECLHLIDRVLNPPASEPYSPGGPFARVADC